MRRSYRLAAATVGLVVLAGGCASHAPAGDQSGPASGSAHSTASGQASDDTHIGNLVLAYDDSPTVERNQATWALPLDPYWGGRAYDFDTLAYDLVRTACMHEAGFRDEHLRTDYSAPKSPTQGAGAVTQLFTVELAKQYGYRMAPDPSDTIAPEIRANGGDWYADKSDEYLNALDACQLQADSVASGWRQERLDAEHRALFAQLHPGVDFPTTEEDLLAWGDELYEYEVQQGAAAANDPANLNRWYVDTSGPELQAAAAQWRDCMAPLGIVDLPAEPWDPMTRPPESLWTRWGWDSPLDPASAEEIEVATHDAQCRQDSGWFDLLYEVTWTQQEALIAQYGDQLAAEYLVPNREMAEHDLKVIREYLPKLGNG